MTNATLSIALPTYSAEDPHGWGQVVDRARAAEAAGFDRILVSDHVVFGEDLEAYARPETGGIEGGRQPTGPDGHWLEPLTVLTYVAALTSRVRLGTNILLAALRRPVVLAKTLATLDVLSGGRVDLGVGIGWQREEYEAAGLDFASARPPARRLAGGLAGAVDLAECPRRAAVAALREHPHDAEAATTRWRAAVGERPCQRPRCSPHRSLRKRLDPVGRRCSRSPDEHPAHARGRGSSGWERGSGSRSPRTSRSSGATIDPSTPRARWPTCRGSSRLVSRTSAPS